MKKILKLTSLLLLICMLTVSLSSCITTLMMIGSAPDPDSVQRFDQPELFTVFMSSFTPFSPDGRWDEMYLIETDDYGRTMFMYSLNFNNMTYHRDKYYVFVCHKSDDTYSYYYDDCFLEIGSSEMTDEEEQLLKDMNDWNLPIDETKLSKTHIVELCGREDLWWETKINAEFLSEYESTITPITVDAKGNRLYFYEEWDNPKENRFELKKRMIVIVTADEEIKHKDISSLDTANEYLESVKEFKALCGWDSSECNVLSPLFTENEHTSN